MLLPKILSLLAIIFILASPLAFPFAAYADGLPGSVGWNLVPDCQDDPPLGSTSTAKVCGFNTLMHLIRHLTDFALFLVMPIAAAIFAWAGFLYLTAGASPGNVGKAKGMFWAAALGLFWTLGAWLVIKLISDALLKPEYTVLPS